MSFSPDTVGRSWFVTVQIKNMIKAGLKEEQYMNYEFLADFLIKLWENSGKARKAGLAICKSEKGLYHVHIACYGNSTTLKNVSNIFFQAHVEPVLGKAQLKEYILKEGKYVEKGEEVLYSKNIEIIEENQGKRSDLEEIERLLSSGMTPEEIYEVSFRYRKFEKMIKAAYLSKRIKETPLMKEMWNEYHWGRSGSGKTYTYIKLCEKYSPEEVYMCNDYANSGSSGGGFDFYTNNPAKIVVLDEFRGNIPYNQFLSLLDVYSRNQQHCRFQNTYNLWESVIICSIYPPEKVYSFMVEETQKSVDSIQQLMRRLNVIIYHYVVNGEYKTFSMPASEYISAEDMMNKAKANELVSTELEQIKKSDSDAVMDMELLEKEWGAKVVIDSKEDKDLGK